MIVKNDSSNTKATVWKNFEGVQKFCFKPIDVNVGLRRWFYHMEFILSSRLSWSNLCPYTVLLRHHNGSFLPQNTLDSFLSTFHQKSYIFRNFPSMRNALTYLTALTVPLLIFCSNDKDGNGKTWSKTLCEWIDVYRNSKLYLMILAE